MTYYLDSNIIIYIVERIPLWHARAEAHLARLGAGEHDFAISALTWSECLVVPLRAGNEFLLGQFLQFFHESRVRTIPLTHTIAMRAAGIRAAHSYATAGLQKVKRYGLADALHLAAAIEANCDAFLTNDQRLSGFLDLPIDVLN